MNAKKTTALVPMMMTTYAHRVVTDAFGIQPTSVRVRQARIDSHIGPNCVAACFGFTCYSRTHASARFALAPFTSPGMPVTLVANAIASFSLGYTTRLARAPSCPPA
jgi:hypothetical protein